MYLRPGDPELVSLNREYGDVLKTHDVIWSH